MTKVLIITGPAGDAHGWGDLSVTETVCEAIKAKGRDSEIAFVSTMDEFYDAIENKSYDIIWSALYYISDKIDTIGLSDGEWLADIFDARKIPYIGPNAATMKALIQKTVTHDILDEKGIAVPYHYKIGVGDPIPDLAYPAFVKPSNESRSVGISDDSVVNNEEELKRQVKYINDEFDQPALVEEFLPGQEYTVLMLGNGEHQKFIPGRIELSGEGSYGKYNILRGDLRGIGVTKILPTNHMTDEAIELGRQAMEALDCLDHVRADMRMDANGKLKIIEVNGIPGLKPVKSWSPQMYTMQYPSGEGVEEDYDRLIDTIVTSAMARYGLE